MDKVKNIELRVTYLQANGDINHEVVYEGDGDGWKTTDSRGVVITRAKSHTTLIPWHRVMKVEGPSV